MNIQELKGRLEELAAKVHNAWWEEKKKQGFHPPVRCFFWPLPHGAAESHEAVFMKHCEWCHPDMYPYEALPKHVKEYDRVTVLAVLNAIEELQISQKDD